ncbi:hypothetical protein FS842_005258 [Serendipita sp. 407]|nr:hypothetical protein FS842_005258 [Serendipita sp. 407]
MLILNPEEEYLTSTLLKNTASQLNILYIRGADEWLSQQDPSPYLNLTSLGSIDIYMSSTDEELLRIMRSLSFLRRLRFIQFSFWTESTEWWNEWWNEELIERLGSVQPSLSEIYLLRKGVIPTLSNPFIASLYEKGQSGVWSKRFVRALTPWQVAMDESFDLKEEDEEPIF